MSTNQFTFPRDASVPIQSGQVRLLYITSAQYSAEWNSSLHTHGCAELFFVVGGHGRFCIQNKEFPVAMNDLVMINTNVPHTESSQLDSPLEYIVLGVEGLESVTGADGFTMLHLHAGRDELIGCLRLMLQEARAGLTGCDAVCQHLLGVILLRLVRRDDFALALAPVGAKANKECDLVRRYIDNHFKENLSLDQLAQLAHINKYHLVHTFRKEFGTSPISYLISRRIQESRFLLRETDHTLSLIAQILGFSSLSYFSQCFRRVEGCSPMEYRKQCQRQSAEF